VSGSILSFNDQGGPPRMHATQTDTLPITESRPVKESGVSIIRKHQLLVRLSHWLNVPILLGLILSGMSIYWASPVYQHRLDPQTGKVDVVADIGVWICAHVPGLHHYSSPPDWVYHHMSLGPYMLASALRLHWFFAYLFMLNGLVYITGLMIGGGWRALLPRSTDVRDALRMMRYYIGVPFAWVLRRTWLHPRFTTKYNALQRLAYFSIPLAGFLSVATGWAIHKPMELNWLAAVFGGYGTARVWHFWLMWVFILFVVPHVILVFSDGWDTLRSMIVGWSGRVKTPEGLENER
jgi:thiosulfate reductase cytochrome b subunit